MIRFFISSTFKDMVEEREAIHKIVLPKVRAYGMEKGVNVDICDLRWGIVYDKHWSEAESISEIMRVCFKEVRDCKPHIIAILGDHYGSTAPDTEMIRRRWIEMGKKDTDIPEGNISLTQWELEFAFLSQNSEDSRALCLLTKGDDAEQNEQIRVLRERVLKKSESSGGQIECDYYDKSNIETFAERFIEYAERVIDKEAQEYDQKNWVERELKYAEAYCVERSADFAGREKFLRAFNQFLREDNAIVLGFYGPSGIGKSSLMAKLYQRSCRRKDCASAMIACGVSQYSSQYLKVLLEIIYILESNLFGDAADVKDNIFSEEKAEMQLEETLALYRKKQDAIPLVLFVDAMDKLSVNGTNQLVSLFLRAEVSNIKLICSQIEPFNVKHDGFRFQKVSDLTKKEIEQILFRKLYNAGQQHIASGIDPVVEAIMQKEDSSSPLYINIVRNILRIHMAEGQILGDRDTTFVERIRKLPEKLPGICREAIAEAINYILSGNQKDKDDNAKAAKDMMMQVMCVIAASKHGLRELDLERIFADRRWRSAAFSGVRLYIADFLRQKDDGCWTFEHDIIRKSLLDVTESEIREFAESNGITMDTEMEAKRRIFDYASGENSDLEVRVREGLYLSYFFDDGDLALGVLESIIEEGTAIREIAARELWGVLQEESGELWFRVLIRTNTGKLLRILGGLMEQTFGESFERRVPAKAAADAFIEMTGLLTDRDVRHWCEVKGRTDEEKYAMAYFCTEYVFVCESVGEKKRMFEYLFMPAEYWSNDKVLENLDEKQKNKACRHLNGLLYGSNLLLNQLNRVSRDLIKWYERDPLEMKEHDPRVYTFFLGNTAQYYSAIEVPEKGLPYRFLAIIARARNLCQYLDNEKVLSYEKILQLCHVTQEQVDQMDFSRETLHRFQVSKHWPFWRSVEQYIAKHITDEETRKPIEDIWSRLAVGYRNFTYDIERFTEELDADEQLILEACECAEISLKMLQSEFMDNERELLTSELKRIQIYLKHPRLTRARAERIVEWSAAATEHYLDNDAYFGEDMKGSLLFTIEKAEKRLKRFQGISGELAEIRSMLGVSG